jgi:hypothetical protein
LYPFGVYMASECMSGEEEVVGMGL